MAITVNKTHCWKARRHAKSAALLAFWLAAALCAAQGGGPRWNNEALRDAGRPSFSYEVVEAFGKASFKAPVMTVPYVSNGERRVLVLGRHGEMWNWGTDFSGREPSLGFDLARRLAGAGDPRKLGLTLMGAVFDREFPRRPYLYVRYSVRAGALPMNKLARFEVVDASPLKLGKREEILAWESNGHDGGDLKWGPHDGYLYISAGDGSAPGDPDNVGQQTEKIRGSILRVDVHGNSGDQPYRVPDDNPFVGMEGVRPELWCYGLRNPWRMAFHPASGELWVGDNGDEHWELVQRIRRGANYGWSAFEGSHVFRADNALQGPTRELTPPVIEHPHAEMRSIIGGVFYRGDRLPGLRGHYVYGCYFTKRLWAVRYEDGVVGEPFQIADAGGAVVSIDEDDAGEFFITCHDGPIYRLRKVAQPPSRRPWPRRLSETGLFADTARHQPSPGVIPYLTNAEAWSDGATKERFVAVPPDGRLKQNGGRQLVKSMVVPEGTALAQTLSLRDRRVETQVLYYDGMWRGYTYRWNDDGSDAVLVGPERLEEEVALPDGGTQRWTFLSRAECMTCHTQRTNFAISLSTPQLDRPGPDGENQLARLLRDGYLANSPSLQSRRNEPFPDPYDSSLRLERRARAYLDLNCAHCHRETGLGGRAGFQLMATLPLGETGIVNAKAVVGMAAGPGALVVAPGAPERSELLLRMARRGAGQMPLIGTHVIDEKGVALIREWIRAMPVADE